MSAASESEYEFCQKCLSPLGTCSCDLENSPSANTRHSITDCIDWLALFVAQHCNTECDKIMLMDTRDRLVQLMLARKEMDRLRGWLSWIEANFGSVEAAMAALNGDKIPA